LVLSQTLNHKVSPGINPEIFLLLNPQTPRFKIPVPVSKQPNCVKLAQLAPLYTARLGLLPPSGEQGLVIPIPKPIVVMAGGTTTLNHTSFLPAPQLPQVGANSVEAVLPAVLMSYQFAPQSLVVEMLIKGALEQSL
jgi:hypothetical protein